MRSARIFLYVVCVAALSFSTQSNGQTPCASGVGAATPATKLDDLICNPTSGATEKVTSITPDKNGQTAFVVTDQQNMFLTITTVDASFTPVVPAGQSSVTYTVTAVTTDTVTGLVSSVKLQSSADPSPPSDYNVVTHAASPPTPPPSNPGIVPQPVTGSGPTPVYRVAVGTSGSNGGDAYCLWSLWGCWGWPGDPGGNGSAPVPNPYSLVVPSSYGAISTTGASIAGITAGSVGGDGGRGGDSYSIGGSDGYAGGNAGNGGTLILENHTSVTTGSPDGTSGTDAYGVFAFSRAGKGGTAGNCGSIFGCSAGTGGAAAVGGPVTLTNYGDVTTYGVGAVGLFALSTGGWGGTGGSAYGLVGIGGSSSAGGNGGAVTLYNSGKVTTHGGSAYGVLAQSVGGTGGNGGDAGGLFSQSGQGAPGGNGSNVMVTNAAAGEITTNGTYANGILAQSIGGNGGASGSAGGLVTLGGSGGYGATPGTVSVENFGRITTNGDSAAGIKAQSIGGGGGAVGDAGGLVTIGGSATLGGTGQAVTVNNAGQITTTKTASVGILAQSIGGGGGSVGSSGGLVTLGGTGGGGGNGGTVTVSNSGYINTGSTTSGAGSDAIVAQSIGGGGGSVGTNAGLVALTLGSNGSGGAGAAVTVENQGQITTIRDDSRGIVAQSIGGGGGSAGSAAGLVTLGGKSGSGGNASAVSVITGGGLNTAISTSGARSDAIVAQSIGGGGGSAGWSAGAVTLGGSAASGGTGGTVTLSNQGDINTSGDDSRGILAQSIGGGGGVAGKSGGAVTLGGSGGSGNDANTVTVTNEAGGSISTEGARSTGILAQSIGGGGGAGGSSGGVVALGGSGSAGGAGKQVTVTQMGTITTQGSDSLGIVAQSVGGGGGNGGSASSGGLFAGLAIGGKGNSGGDGGQSKVLLGTDGNSPVQPNSVTTSGDRSIGVLVQSVGGGGGNGGSAYQGTAGAGVSVSVALGGSGSVGGKGGQVSLDGASNIETSGQNASGIVLQSVGGGGGNGGTTISGSLGGDGLSVAVGVGGPGAGGGAGGAVNANLTGGAVTTQGDQSAGIVLQSVGGGGGNGGLTVAGSAAIAIIGGGSVSVGVGGSGGKGGAAGTVDASIGSNITTSGDNATGLVIQGVGGGGGNSGLTVAAGGAIGGGGAGAISVGVGASGGNGGAGGQVTAGYSGVLTTVGSHSAGILAQSIGGGGGNSGGTISAAFSGAGVGSGGVSVGVGGDGGGGGAGGKVTFTTDAGSSVTTEGSSSAGMLVQSIGGGGGNGGYTIAASAALAGTGSGTVSVGVGGNGGTGGDAGTVDATLNSDVTTNGENSAAIAVQSIGGGGGNSGVTVSGGAALAGVGAGAVSVGVGGNGGIAGNGNIVTAEYQGTINTSGDRSVGLLAQSIGGGGGNAGGTIAADLSGAGTGAGGIGVGIGGNGGGAGYGDAVTATVDPNSKITTSGTSSTGILVQSIGGGGGNGGYTITASAAGAGTGSGTVSVGVGGGGGSGGEARTVNATLNADVTTSGENSGAIAVQSIGGGGGNGGLNVTASGAFAGTGSGTASVGIGGSGGDGGKGGEVNSIVNGNLATGDQSAADNSAGLLVQSIGGGGGNAGIQVTGAIAAAGTGAGGVGVGIGGSGGGGGAASLVNSSFAGNVDVNGNNSGGVVVQSLGGGGGNGGMNITGTVALAGTGAGGVAVGIGGSGGGGGAAGLVNSTLTGTVATNGNNSGGVIVQSLGGGGGNGGMNISGTIGLASNGAGAVAVGIGGSGGGGGKADQVNSHVTGNVSTNGNESIGVFAQSLGGGGGNGGINVSGSVTASKQDSGNLAVGVGGFGGLGGNADTVSSFVFGNVDTQGNESDAIVAQSLGGGGGKGGLNVSGSANLSSKGAGIGVGVGGFGGSGGNGAAVNLIAKGDLTTTGEDSAGILAQSIGGGGGKGGVNVSGALNLSNGGGGVGGTVSIGVGGFGGDGGASGDVNVQFDGSISTNSVPAAEKGSSGLVAQSIGGGGGAGGINVSGGISIALAKAKGYGLAVGIGGFGGAGGNAGNVTANVTGDKSINGWGSDQAGILAQSIGGGGGNGGLNVTGGIASDSQIMVGVGGSGGNGGLGKGVSVNSSADVSASATDATEPGAAGVLAQSIGGGGGNGGLNVTGGLLISKPDDSLPSITVGVGGQGGAGAASGNVAVTQTGDVTTSGNWVDGINAQSIGGGGGNGGLNVSGAINFSDSETFRGAKDLSIVAGVGGSGGAGANAGNVTVNNSGLVSTDGDNAKGVFAQSVGGGGGRGGLNVTGVFAQKGQPIAVSVGGCGDTGGDAGSAAIQRGTADAAAGKVSTTGENANAIEASSVGGGGGDGGMTFNAGFSLAGKGNSPDAFSAQFLLGGSGADAGIGGAAKVTNYSDVSTEGAHSTGVMAQSVGGGGGNAGISVAATYQDAKDSKNMGLNLAIGGGTGNGGKGGTADVVNVGNVDTWGDASYGILSQSIGGGGGNAALTMAYTHASGSQLGISIGRYGGTGGAGADVSLSSDGVVVTRGTNAFGLFAQSVGNGGGNSSATSVSLTPAAGESGEPSKPINVSVGLEGGQGGSAGNVSLNAAGTVGTTGSGSTAIFAQSVGGGGGTGGGSLTAGLTAAALGLALGGEGGEGGTGGNVTVTSSASVNTASDKSAGILAQSVGGGGGTGGYAVMGGYKVGKYSANLAIGGAGGTGMSAGLVDVTNNGSILTHGADSYGVLAQSIGGGGGEGGLVIGITRVPGDTTATTVGVAIGGNGGTGGTSGDVTLNNTGWVGTTGGNAVGLFAQSVGGGGGNGSTVVNALGGGSQGSNSVSVGVGGTGGTGGSAGNVNVENAATSQVVTQGDGAHGIFALSVGGGGGTGSTVVSVPISKGATPGQTKAGSLAVSVGGSGGDAGTGGNVTVINDGSIYTSGKEAHGILAESVGGGGGQGGMAISGDIVLNTATYTQGTNFAIAVGGSGGDGNKSGNVDVTNRGTIEVSGDKSYGVYAQSVGGGGGNGRLAVALSSDMLNNAGPQQPWLTNFSLGGFGGDGGDGGAVTVNNTGNIISRGNNSYGIFAQSVGGGGGKAGLSISSPAYMAASFVLDTLLGGGSNGAPGTVQVNQNGNIIMLGQNSQAQLVQSVNGGGGDTDLYLDFSEKAIQLGEDGLPLPPDQAQPTGSASVTYWLKLGYDKLKGALSAQNAAQASIAGAPLGAAQGAQASVADAALGAVQASAADTSVTNTGDFFTGGAKSIASLVQSIGGGGGNANSTTVVDTLGQVSTQAALGAAQADSSNGGNITIVRTGSVTTLGNDSAGNSVQSIGGGGGTLLAEVDRVVSSAATNSLGSATVVVTLGANQTTASNGGAVNMQTAGEVATAGARSTGLLLQSIGGGGGTVSLAGYDSAQVVLGGTNGTSGNGGAINFTNTGSITTTGTMAHGVVLQSIGGGGGALFTGLDASHVSVTANTANSGNGDNIQFTQNGDVSVHGENAIGVLAQSLGGGGGIVDRTFMNTAGGSGTSGSLNLVINGNVTASGANGIGIFAQSHGANGQGDISINLAADKFIHVGTNGIGVQISGGNHNQFTNHGSIFGADGVNTWAIVGNSNDRVDNYGTIAGQINLGGGSNQFFNHAGALFIPGPQISLGDPSNLLQNDGNIVIGPNDKTQQTAVNGSFVQTASGSTYAKLDFRAGAIDQLNMTGTASLAGKLNLNLINPELVPYGHFTKPVFSAAGGLSNNGIVLNTAPSAVISYQLLSPNSTSLTVDYNVEFAPSALSPKLKVIGDYFNRIQAAGSSSGLASTVTKLIYDPDLAAYQQSLQQLTPDFYGELQSGLIVSNQRFAQTLIEGGSAQYVGKRGMVWLNFGYEDLRHSGYGDYKAVRQIGRRGGAGFQKRFGKHWTAGLGLSWQDTSAAGNDGLWTALGHTTQFGGMVMREFGQTVLSGTLSYSWNKTSSQRVGNLNAPFTGQLQRGLGTFGATARVSHVLKHGAWYLKPMVDLGLTDMLAHSATESGVGATALVLGGYSEKHLWLRPAAEVGRTFNFTDSTALRPFLNVANRSYLNGGTTYARAGFADAPSSVGPMAVPIDIGAPFEGTVGLEFAAGNHLSLGLEYGKTSGNHYNMNRFNFFLRIPFGK